MPYGSTAADERVGERARRTTNWFTRLALPFLLLTLTSCQSRPTTEPSAGLDGASGIDVSHYQGVVNWDELKAAQLSFAFAKATGGTRFVDPQFEANWHGMRTAGIVRGAYHFFYASEDAEAQAELFVRTVQELSGTDLPPVLDVEISDGATQDEITQGVLDWLKAVEQKLARKPILYTNVSFGEKYLTDPRLGEYPLWIAEYNPVERGVPSPWESTSWSFWQHSQSGSIDGIDGAVDLNVYNGSARELWLFVERQKLTEVLQTVEGELEEKLP